MLSWQIQEVSNVYDHGWCGCSPDIAPWTWPTYWECPGGDACHSCCRIWKMWLRSIAERWLACTHHPRCPRDARLDWNQVSEHAGQSMQVTCCCCYCKNLLKTQALCRQVLSYWRIASCPMACKEWTRLVNIVSEANADQVCLGTMQRCSLVHPKAIPHCDQSVTKAIIPSQWHHRSTLLDISKFEIFHHWRTEWTVNGRVNHDSSVKSTLNHCCLVHARWC